MRKRYRKKLLSCPLCKPNKTGGALRFNAREFSKLKEFEKERLEWNKL
ncbi:MAG: hypothetical protein Q7K54_01640 [Candidatus Parcubacteria bacterium]|nr:hypothetical protein [Candidatus Parcubacteria bacterium]